METISYLCSEIPSIAVKFLPLELEVQFPIHFVINECVGTQLSYLISDMKYHTVKRTRFFPSIVSEVTFSPTHKTMETGFL